MEERKYREVFDSLDSGRNGTISVKVLQYAMRRAGHNPTDIEVQDLVNKIDTESAGLLVFQDFLELLQERGELDVELHFKDTFRAFSKDEDGCIPAEELKFVLTNLPGKVPGKEIEEMIRTVDRNGDGRISYSEFRVMMGGFPLIVPNDPVMKMKIEEKVLNRLKSHENMENIEEPENLEVIENQENLEN
ncbi:calmodulin-2/4 [Eurytemora carolleeae]|uniref:calmodulin-2/4 n=1 Tax=Eurytemora carolleeae TaxID=1294199 RepID=UPI000C767BFC|nr:calmodulin-2/4 [Eurytemora carolleeae]|eukprot:XP_023347025.1 calmodulin-2/4-like [Eurytemora affinis]